MDIMQRLRSGFTAGRANREAARAKVMRDHAIKLDQKHIRKAVRRSPEAPVLITRAIGRIEVQALLGMGWELHSSSRSQWGGTDLWGEYILTKPNPMLEAEAS